MLHAKLVREGFKVNVKVVERLYREERVKRGAILGHRSGCISQL